jgi:hydroxylamine dehydrogenase
MTFRVILIFLVSLFVAPVVLAQVCVDCHKGVTPKVVSDWQKERDKMVETCHRCRSVNFAKGELVKGDQMIKQADHLMAEAIRTVAGLYKDGLLPKPQSYAHPFPDLLTFHDAPTVIEQKLFVMYLEHRMRTFQGTFHANPDYAFWYGWSEMQRDLTEIKTMAEELRRDNKAGEK